MFKEIFTEAYIKPNLKPDYMSSKMFNELVDSVGLENAANPVFVRGWIDKNVRERLPAYVDKPSLDDYMRGYNFNPDDVMPIVVERAVKEGLLMRVVL